MSGCSQALGCFWREPVTVLPVRHLSTKAGVLWRASKFFSRTWGPCPLHPLPDVLAGAGQGGIQGNKMQDAQVRLDFRCTCVILGVRTPPGQRGTHLY